MGIEDYSTTASSNNSAPPNGAPENMAPSAVNDTIRQIMADIRTWYESGQWTEIGGTPTYASGTSFTITGDVTTTFTVGRRVKFTDASTLYGTVTASSYAAPDTTVTVTMDSGSLSASLTVVTLGAITPSSNALPPMILRKGADVASAASLAPTKGYNFYDVTGTTGITSIATSGNVGTTIWLQFDGVVTLTHHATNLILPNGADYTTAAGDILGFYEYGSGMWHCIGVNGSTTNVKYVSKGTGDSPYTASARDFVFCDTSAGTLTVTLPASPVQGDRVTLCDVTGSFHTNNLTVGRNSLKIMGLSENMTVASRYVTFTLIYTDATNGWRIM